MIITIESIIKFKNIKTASKKASTSVRKSLLLGITWKTGNKNDGPKKKEYDNQILSAVDVLKGIVIYNKK